MSSTLGMEQDPRKNVGNASARAAIQAAKADPNDAQASQLDFKLHGRPV